MGSGVARFGGRAVAAVALLAAGFFLGGEIAFNAEPDDILVPKWHGQQRPDAQLFRDARAGLQAYRTREVPPLGIGDLRLVENPETGLIQSAWFLVHKGEAEQKVQIAVWGSFYRVDVWTRGVLTGHVSKTFMSRVAEREIQQDIEAQRHSRSAAVSSATSATASATAPPKTNYATETSSSSIRASAAGR